jgi:hypothetical protein
MYKGKFFFKCSHFLPPIILIIVLTLGIKSHIQFAPNLIPNEWANYNSYWIKEEVQAH